MALQYMVRNVLRLPKVIAFRVGRGVHQVKKAAYVTACILVYYEDDDNPYFKYYETKDTAVNVQGATGSTKASFMLLALIQIVALCCGFSD